ncbi:MAG: aminotransferase class IV [Alphaproteobacteria bacterium]
MVQRANERVAYFNGKIVPESEVVIPFRDRGFIAGDAVFDTARTFRHKTFRLKEHVDRFYRSLKYVGIDPGLSKQEMTGLSEEVAERNLHLIDREDDYWLSQRVSRGVDEKWGDKSGGLKPTVIIECTPLPLKARAPLFRDGIPVLIPAIRRTPPDSLSPRAKTHNYLNLIVAANEVAAVDKEAWAVLLDTNGNLAEGIGSNIFLARDGEVLTPQVRYVLPGVSRATVLEIAAGLGIPTRECDLDLYDVRTADEAFITSTSLCMCPVRSIGSTSFPVPGPLTKRLSDAYAKLVGVDFVAQYLRHLS